MEDSSTRVLISAGVHPEEEAGVLYLQTVNKYSGWNKDICVSIVPCRNTYGFNITKHLDFNHRLKCCDFGDFYLSGEGRFFLVPQLPYLKSKGSICFWESLKNFVYLNSMEGYLDILSLRNSSQIHATSFYMVNGRIFDLNSRSSIIDIVFELSTNNLLREYRPHYFIDLHESIGNVCYLYVRRTDLKACLLARNIVKILIKYNVPIRNSAEDREMLSKGVFALESFSDYSFLEDKCLPVEIVFETGIDASISDRLSWISLFFNSLFQLFQCRHYDKTFDIALNGYL